MPKTKMDIEIKVRIGTQEMTGRGSLCVSVAEPLADLRDFYGIRATREVADMILTQLTEACKADLISKMEEWVALQRDQCQK